MPNMSYCRFENTYNDLQECLEALGQEGVKNLEENANEYEKPYIRKLIELCNEVAEDFGDEI